MPALRPNLKAKFHKDPYTAKVFLSKPKPREVPPMQNRPLPGGGPALVPRLNKSMGAGGAGVGGKDSDPFRKTQVLNPTLVERAGGDMSLAQKRLENARHQDLMNKLRGKTMTSGELSAMSQTLGMSFYREQAAMESQAQSVAGMSEYESMGAGAAGQESPREREKEKEKEEEAKGPAQWSELDKFIELLLDNKHTGQSLPYINRLGPKASKATAQ